MQPLRDPFVVLDLSACVVVDPAKLQRCLDTSLRASEEPSGLDELLETLDRVLLAHVTSDPFVDERAGTSALLRSLARHRVPTFGLATFAPPVIAAITERFGWHLTYGAAQAASPVWSAAALAADLAGFERAQVAFVSDDPWEVAHAANDGCGLAIHVGAGPRRVEDAHPGVLHVPSMHDVAWVVGATTTRSAPALTLRPMPRIDAAV
jgi:hypothetical protein